MQDSFSSASDWLLPYTNKKRPKKGIKGLDLDLFIIFKPILIRIKKYAQHHEMFTINEILR